MEDNIPIMEIKNVSKTLDKKKVVDNVRLDVYPGEIFGFLGPNGSGKTTTIRMLVGLISMTEGQVLIKGADIAKEFEQAISQVGAIVENPEMYDYLTGYQNLLHYSRMAGGISEERKTEVIKRMGLENAIHDKVKTYSLGMKQRLGLAQALVHSPSILILDEPTNGLDPAGMREFRHHLIRLTREERISVFVSSHLLSEMELMCDRMGIIQHGQLLDVQSVHDVVEKDLLVVLTVDAVHQAEQTLRGMYPEQFIKVQDKTIQTQLDDEQIPRVIKGLTEEGVNIYGVETTTETLEDQFMEVTGGQNNV